MDISRGEHGIIFVVVRTFQQESFRAKKLLAKAADALVRGDTTASEKDVQEEQDMLQLNAERIHSAREHRNFQEREQGGEGSRLVGTGSRWWARWKDVSQERCQMTQTSSRSCGT